MLDSTSLLNRIRYERPRITRSKDTHRGQKPFRFDPSTFLFFLVWTLVSCPPNILWQIFLEEKFPASKYDVKTGEKGLSKGNTVKKFLMDQSFGATANTVGYIAALAAWRGKDFAAVSAQVQQVRSVRH